MVVGMNKLACLWEKRCFSSYQFYFLVKFKGQETLAKSEDYADDALTSGREEKAENEYYVSYNIFLYAILSLCVCLFLYAKCM